MRRNRPSGSRYREASFRRTMDSRAMRKSKTNDFIPLVAMVSWVIYMGVHDHVWWIISLGLMGFGLVFAAALLP